MYRVCRKEKKHWWMVVLVEFKWLLYCTLRSSGEKFSSERMCRMDGGGLWLQVQVYINLFLYLPPSHLHVGGSCNSVMVGNKNSS